MDKARYLQLGALALATLALVVGAWMAEGSMTELTSQQQVLRMQEMRLADASRQSDDIARREAYIQRGMELQEQALAMHAQPEFWAQQRVSVRQGVQPHGEVNHTLAQLQTNKQRMFVADTFELSVTTDNEGLFQPPSATSRGILLSLTGDLYFSLGDR